MLNTRNASITTAVLVVANSYMFAHGTRWVASARVATPATCSTVAAPASRKAKR